MACVALTSLIETVELEFLQPNKRVRVSTHDRPPIISFLANLYGLQAKIQKDSSGDGDGGAPRDFEIEIRNFALKAEDDIEIQLSHILLLAEEEGEGGQKAFLHQTFREATRNARELLKKIIISCRAKQPCPSDTEDMAASVVALSILITKFEYYYFSQLTPAVSSLDDKATMKSFFTELYCLQALLLLQRKPGGGAAIKNLETEITEFSLKAEAEIEMQLSNILLGEDSTECREKAKASHQLIHQTLREAEQNATQLLKKRIAIEKDGGEMAAAIVALTNLITKIKYNLLKPFSTLSLCDQAATIKSFHTNLSSLQAFLHKASSGIPKESSGALKYLEKYIRDFALKAEEDIQIQLTNILLAEEETDYRERDSRKLHQTLRESAKNAAWLLKFINSASNEAGKDEEAIQTQTQSSIHSSKLRDSEFENNAKELVGRGDDQRLLIWGELKQHFKYHPELKLISIVGMTGIGKTALARNAYIDKEVEKEYDVRCWIAMPKTYNETQMLRSLLGSITPVEPNEIKKGSTPYELAEQVCKRLKGKRFLIVLDNFWNNEAWINIKRCFPEDRNGSRILLTTTHFDRDSYASSSYYIHNMTLLDLDQSWDLFCSTLSIKGHMAAAKFIEEIRRDVVEKCDGLPQLIIAVAKRLYNCNNIQQEWKKIEKELESLGILDRNALIPSYSQLPQHLKVCFLYLGVFPKRYQILAKILIRLWIAEGFVKPLEHKELETQAFGFLQELTDRSLLLIGNHSSDGKIKTCRLHSALHSFCVVEAQKEGILCAVNTQKHSGLPLKVFANSCRWLSFYSHRFDYYVLFRTNIPRSTFIFHENPEMFVRLKLLRVLALDTCIFLQRVPLHLGDLVYLRYLSITQWFEGMDDVLSNNPNLQTLVVSNNESHFGAPTVHLPSSIWEAPWLRHLELGNFYRVDPPSMVKGNLQSLSCMFRPIHCRKKVYDKFPNIKKLKIFLKDDIEGSHTCGSCSNPIFLDDLVYLEKLEKLAITVSVSCSVTLKEWSVFPSQLMELRLSGTHLSDRDLTAIAKLPKLKVLKLDKALHGTVWKTPTNGFPFLKFLLLEDTKLKKWEWQSYGDYSFPLLEHLVLRFCYHLETIPDIFLYRNTLKSIVLEECCSSVMASAKWIQKYQNYCVELKILGTVYDESQRTDMSIEDDLASPTLSK